jgi:hypothetical protein
LKTNSEDVQYATEEENKQLSKMKKNVVCEETLEVKCAEKCFFQREVVSFETKFV